MSDAFYRFVRFIGSPVFWSSAAPMVLGREHVLAAAGGARDGARGRGTCCCIIAPTHESPYDVPLLIVQTPLLLDFVSITEVFAHPLVAWFYGSLNAFPLDRSKPDSGAVRTILARLKRGRTVVMFPEGRLRAGKDSVVHTRKIKTGIGRVAQMAGASIVPCVIINSGAYQRPVNWLPLFWVRYGIIYGEPLLPEVLGERIEVALVDALVALHAQLRAAMDEVEERRGRR